MVNFGSSTHLGESHSLQKTQSPLFATNLNRACLRLAKKNVKYNKTHENETQNNNHLQKFSTFLQLKILSCADATGEQRTQTKEPTI